MLGFGWLGFSDGVPAWPVSLEIGEISRFPAWLFLSQFYNFCENRVCIWQNAVVFMTTSFTVELRGPRGADWAQPKSMKISSAYGKTQRF